MRTEDGPCGRRAPVRLRTYQQEAIEQLEARVRAGVRRVVIVAPTGSGKTTIAGEIIARAVEDGSRVLFVAHRRELIFQAYNRLIQFGIPERQVGVLMGQDRRRRPGAHVQVASIDTLRNRAKPRADIVFVDECHRVISRSYQDVSAHYPDALHLGLTATPMRANGDGLGDAYDELLVVTSPRKLMDQGYLVEPRVFTVPRSQLPDLSGVRTRRGDYETRALAEAVDQKGLVGNLVEHWMRHAQGVPTVAFAVSVAHSQNIAEQFRAAGVAAEHLDGTTPTAERDALLKRLESGETTLVSNCGVLCEGWDQPAVKCAILARPTKSLGLYLQQAGRILRLYNDQRAVILDHGGCVIQHGLPQDERTFNLNKAKKRAKGEVRVRTCPECCAVLSLNTRVCPECDKVLITQSDVPSHRDGTLVEVRSGDEALSGDRKRRELERLHAIAASRGYKPGWVYHRYRDKFGEAPPPSAWGKGIDAADQPAFRANLRRAIRAGSVLDWATVDAALEHANRPK